MNLALFSELIKDHFMKKAKRGEWLNTTHMKHVDEYRMRIGGSGQTYI